MDDGSPSARVQKWKLKESNWEQFQRLHQSAVPWLHSCLYRWFSGWKCCGLCYSFPIKHHNFHEIAWLSIRIYCWSFLCTIPQTGSFVTPVVEHWLEREIAQWVHPMKDRSDDPSHHERTALPLSYVPLLPIKMQPKSKTGPSRDSNKKQPRVTSMLGLRRACIST